jgi:hypothetical protein
MKRLFAITSAMLLSTAMIFVVVCAAGDTKPMRGVWSGKAFFFESFEAPMYIIVNGKGNATQLGKTDYFAYLVPNDTDKHPDYYLRGGAVDTAADGDALYLEIYFKDDPVSGTWEQIDEIVGGTGKFAGASGNTTSSGTYVIDMEPSILPYIPSITWAGTSKGWIRY